MISEKLLLEELVKISKQNLTAIGYQKLTVDATVGGVSLTVPTDAKYALIVVESDLTTPAIRYLECGNTVFAVTSSNGIPRSNGDAFDVQGRQNLVSFKAIQVGAGTHALNIQYYK
jgi:hypothetical protein